MERFCECCRWFFENKELRLGGRWGGHVAGVCSACLYWNLGQRQALIYLSTCPSFGKETVVWWSSWIPSLCLQLLYNTYVRPQGIWSLVSAEFSVKHMNSSSCSAAKVICQAPAYCISRCKRKRTWSLLSSAVCSGKKRDSVTRIAWPKLVSHTTKRHLISSSLLL